MTATPEVSMERGQATIDVSTATPLSFETFYATNSESVARALAVTLNDGELAADATNEAMLRAYQRWAKISGYDNPAAWVYRVGLNWSLSWKRRRRRERDKPVQLSADHSVQQIRDDSFDGAIAGLSVEHRAVVVCRVHLDWSVSQTAEALDVPEGTVKSRLARALEQLKTTVEHQQEVQS